MRLIILWALQGSLFVGLVIGLSLIATPVAGFIGGVVLLAIAKQKSKP